ncbi:hypothetical protein Efla_006809 [Eimeria flavescens]
MQPPLPVRVVVYPSTAPHSFLHHPLAARTLYHVSRLASSRYSASSPSTSLSSRRRNALGLPASSPPQAGSPRDHGGASVRGAPLPLPFSSLLTHHLRSFQTSHQYSFSTTGSRHHAGILDSSSLVPPAASDLGRWRDRILDRLPRWKLCHQTASKLRSFLSALIRLWRARQPLRISSALPCASSTSASSGFCAPVCAANPQVRALLMIGWSLFCFIRPCQGRTSDKPSPPKPRKLSRLASSKCASPTPARPIWISAPACTSVPNLAPLTTVSAFPEHFSPRMARDTRIDARNSSLLDDLQQLVRITKECDDLTSRFPLKGSSACLKLHGSATTPQQLASAKESAVQQPSAVARASPSSGGGA